MCDSLRTLRNTLAPRGRILVCFPKMQRLVAIGSGAATWVLCATVAYLLPDNKPPVVYNALSAAAAILFASGGIPLALAAAKIVGRDEFGRDLAKAVALLAVAMAWGHGFAVWAIGRQVGAPGAFDSAFIDFACVLAALITLRHGHGGRARQALKTLLFCALLVWFVSGWVELNKSIEHPNWDMRAAWLLTGKTFLYWGLFLWSWLTHWGRERELRADLSRYLGEKGVTVGKGVSIGEIARTLEGLPHPFDRAALELCSRLLQMSTVPRVQEDTGGAALAMLAKSFEVSGQGTLLQLATDELSTKVCRLQAASALLEDARANLKAVSVAKEVFVLEQNGLNQAYGFLRNISWDIRCAEHSRPGSRETLAGLLAELENADKEHAHRIGFSIMDRLGLAGHGFKDSGMLSPYWEAEAALRAYMRVYDPKHKQIFLDQIAVAESSSIRLLRRFALPWLTVLRKLQELAKDRFSDRDLHFADPRSHPDCEVLLDTQRYWDKVLAPLFTNVRNSQRESSAPVNIAMEATLSKEGRLEISLENDGEPLVLSPLPRDRWGQGLRTVQGFLNEMRDSEITIENRKGNSGVRARWALGIGAVLPH